MQSSVWAQTKSLAHSRSFSLIASWAQISRSDLFLRGGHFRDEVILNLRWIFFSISLWRRRSKPCPNVPFFSYPSWTCRWHACRRQARRLRCCRRQACRCCSWDFIPFFLWCSPRNPSRRLVRLFKQEIHTTLCSFQRPREHRVDILQLQLLTVPLLPPKSKALQLRAHKLLGHKVAHRAGRFVWHP